MSGMVQFLGFIPFSRVQAETLNTSGVSPVNRLQSYTSWPNNSS